MHGSISVQREFTQEAERTQTRKPPEMASSRKPKLQPCGLETRATEPQALSTDGTSPPMPSPIEARRQQTEKPIPNGAYPHGHEKQASIEHDRQVTISATLSAWWQALGIFRHFVSGLVALMISATYLLYSNGWFNGVAHTSDLTEVRTEIAADRRVLEAHTEALRTLVSQSNDTRSDLSEIKGFLHGLLQANSPAPIVATPPARKKQAHPGSGWMKFSN